uniref:Uncharacterized protein n=1 Tax=Arundo donax TaxID=35708 RepID=A0A0A9GA55_ARUDO
MELQIPRIQCSLQQADLSLTRETRK